MSPVWSGRMGAGPDPEILSYCSGRDVVPLPMADEALIPYDIWNTEAHDIMLWRQGLLPEEHLRVILRALEDLRNAAKEGRFQLDPQKEDVHMNVESRVTEACGPESGRRIHAGRSRNDQVACDMRMYLREHVLAMAGDVVALIRLLLRRGRDEAGTVMPGFSHTRHATLSTFGHLLVSYAQALCRDLQRLLFAYGVVNTNPLGAAAGFGTSWPIDRELTTRLLGFDAVQQNSIDCVTRWEAEAQVASATSFLMNHLSVISQDLIFLSTTEAGMVALHESVVQGSSIMPQKRNPDPLEVTRAKASIAHATLAALLSIERAGLSGYNRDLQYTKYLAMDLIRECAAAPRVIGLVVETLVPQRERMAEMANQDFLNAVDVADLLCRRLDLPFRQSYHVVAEAVRSSRTGRLEVESVNAALEGEGLGSRLTLEDFAPVQDPAAVIASKSHVGGPAPDALRRTADDIESAAEESAARLQELRALLDRAWEEKERVASALREGREVT